ncbi:insulinase family protein [Metabacillus sp. GX 13764]|uniref:EF-P 5-aminopentanol modification-associated protein YfmF n=1 Tax=Metabacillus kandeliae TaxID=2900151 RepID=UPI001E2FE294|nr:pitrilysin family protein [Metabacillus kandeliae]MCD7033712.1 insulinase family protein [Metabacillus kandeliae]
MKLNEKKTEAGGLTVHTVKTDKYKTNTLIFKMLAPLKKESVTFRGILPYVLQRGTESFPGTSELRRHLDELYGATLSADLSKKGENHIITFRMEVANEKFLTDGAPLLEKAVQALSELLLKPLTDGKAFKEEYVNQEKRTLKQRIQGVYDDKMRYSNLRLVQEMCEGEPYALHVNGELDDIASINAENLYAYYQKALKEDKKDLYIIGDVSEEDAAGYIEKYFSFSAAGEKEPVMESAGKKIEEPKEIIEEQEVKQGKLNIGYRTNCIYKEKGYYALQVFNGIFGGFSHSKLFINVREKASLAYYAASRIESHKGLLMVMSGVEVKNYEQAVTIIKEQMEAMKKGDFSEHEIAQTKAVIKNQLLETIDTSYGTAEILYQNSVGDTDRSFEELLNGIEKVTKEEIVEAAGKIELDTVYFLKGTGGQE